MKKNLFQHIFGTNPVRSNRNGGPRPLRLEPLEERQLLAADWTGFNPPSSIEYSSAAEDSGNPYKFETAPEMVQIVGQNIITVDFAGIPNSDVSKDTISYYIPGESGSVSVEQTTFDDSGFGYSDSGIGMTFIDADGDGYADDLIVLKTTDQIITTGNITVNYQIYQENNGKYTKYKNGSFKIAYSNNLTVMGLTAKWSQSAKSLIVQTEIMDITSGGEERLKLSKFVWASGEFGFESQLKSESGINSTLLNIVTLYNGTASSDYAVRTFENGLSFVSISDRTSCDWTWSEGSTYRDFTVDWLSQASIAANDNLIYFGGELNQVAIAKLSVSGTSIVCSAGTITYTGVSFSNSAAVAVGDLNGDSLPDIVVSDGSVSIQKAAASDSSSELPVAGFESWGTPTVVSPQIVSSVILDLVGPDGNAGADGVNDLLMVGSSSVWICYKDAGGNDKWSEISLKDALRGATVQKAVFADMDGDGKIDLVLKTDTTSLFVFTQSVTDGSISFISTRTLTCSPEAGGVASEIYDITVGHFLSTDQLSVAALFGIGGETTNSCVNLFTPAAGKDKEVTLTFTGKSFKTLGADSLYGTGYDDLILGANISGGKASIAILKNNAENNVGSFNTTTGLEERIIVSSGAVSGDTISFQIGDIDGDKTNDLLYLYSSTAANGSKLGYLKNTAGTIAESSTNIATEIESGSVLSGLYFGYVDQDAKMDIMCTATGSNGTKILTWLADADATTGYETYVGSAFSEDPGTFDPSAVSVGRYAGGDYSNDVVIARGKKITIWQNSAKSSGASGQISVLCQSLSQVASADYDTALTSKRTWIDEWSNFWFDLWGNNNGGGAIESFSIQIKYNSNYFEVAADQTFAQTGYTITVSSSAADSNGFKTVTVAGTLNSDATGVGDSDDALIGRVRFTPLGGVDLTAFTEFTSVGDNGFSVNAGMSLINDLGLINGQGSVALADANINSENLKLYPVVMDLNDDGSINLQDFTTFNSFYNRSSADLSGPYIFCDFNNDGSVNISDLTLFFNTYNKGRNFERDSFYIVETPLNPLEMDKSSSSASELPIITVFNEDLLAGTEIIDTPVPQTVSESPLPSSDYVDYVVLLLEEESKKEKKDPITEETPQYDPVDDMVEEFLTRTADRRSLGA